MRISKDDYYLELAKTVSLRSTCLKRQYGCVIVADDQIAATGYNGSPRGALNCCDIHDECPRKDMAHNSGNYTGCPAVHAEQNALISVSRSKSLGSTLYLYGRENDLELNDIRPCPICMGMIRNAGIRRIITPQGVMLL